jgi:hypothetical protein
MSFVQRSEALYATDGGLPRAVLGEDFISPEEIQESRRVCYGDEQLFRLRDTLPDLKALYWCRNNGMMLIAGPPKAMSLLDIRDLKPGYFYEGGGWYESEKFAHDDKAEPVWIAVRKERINGSFSKNWSVQSELVVEPMAVPNAAELVWGLTTYQAMRGEYLLPYLYMRTSSLSGDKRVYVGDFDADGLVVKRCWDNCWYERLGVSASRKF